MTMFRIICRAILEPAHIAKLDERTDVVYVHQGGSTQWPPNERRRHLLEIEAKDQAQALKVARHAVNAVGVEGADISPA
jgi:hypothetical protein